MSTKSNNFVLFEWKEFNYKSGKVGLQVKLSKGDFFDLEYIRNMKRVSIVHERSGAYREIELSSLMLYDPEYVFYFAVGIIEEGDQIEIASSEGS